MLPLYAEVYYGSKVQYLYLLWILKVGFKNSENYKYIKTSIPHSVVSNYFSSVFN